LNFANFDRILRQAYLTKSKIYANLDLNLIFSSIKPKNFMRNKPPKPLTLEEQIRRQKKQKKWN